MLTLPPEVGRLYRFRGVKQYEGVDGVCVITSTTAHRRSGSTIFRSETKEGGALRNWVYWPDGKAKIAPYGPDDHVAELVEDASGGLTESDEFKELKEKYTEMTQRLKELGC